jgi:hypothetical protein
LLGVDGRTESKARDLYATEECIFVVHALGRLVLGRPNGNHQRNQVVLGGVGLTS